MEVIEVRMQGFCQGVARAIDTARKAAGSKQNGPVTILGSLVHNRHVNEDLQSLGVRILESKGTSRLELLDQIDEGTVIFTAHGVSDKVREKARKKGLHAIDASCPFVIQTQNQIREAVRKQMTVFYIGSKGHPEAEGALEDYPDSTYLIEQQEDIPSGIGTEILVTTQTTMSIAEVQDLFEAIAVLYPHARFCDELCSATRLRQQAVRDLEGQNIDLLVVVGDPSSNNTAKLADTGRIAGIPRILRLESAEQLDPADLAGCRRAAVTSGASTPRHLRDEVVRALRLL